MVTYTLSSHQSTQTMLKPSLPVGNAMIFVIFIVQISIINVSTSPNQCWSGILVSAWYQHQLWYQGPDHGIKIYVPINVDIWWVCPGVRTFGYLTYYLD